MSHAVDGVIEISQVGATAGFPVTITAPGSYRLTSNLDVSGEASPENTTAILVTADDVSIDLNHFTIRGPNLCAGVPPNCTLAGSGVGIQSIASNTRVRNGSVRGMGSHGLSLGNDARVSDVALMSNGGDGARLGLRGTFEQARATANGGNGLGSGEMSVVHASLANDNAGFGLSLGTGSAYSNNSLGGNNSDSGAPQVSISGSIVEFAPNLCGTDTSCDLCGDLTCSASESCSTCEADCGVCSPVTRFVVLGDTGEGNADQALVASAIESVCLATGGCDFAILLGDNIYHCGVTSTSDPQWATKFETPYANLNFPFYAALGDHDFGCATPDFALGNHQVNYTAVSSKWNMPESHYTFTAGNAGFIVLDTTRIQYDTAMNGDQYAWYPTAVASLSASEWVFAVGHHPLRSNGPHGNAGSYDGFPPLISIPSGALVENFFDTHVCGTVDAAFAAHDHSRQWLNEPTELCGAELIVSGAGSKLSATTQSSNTVHFEDDTIEGFLWVELDGATMTGRFYDSAGNLDFERIVTK